MDADATQIRIYTEQNALGGWDKLVIEDNGHGLPRREALIVFESIGGSQKRSSHSSPGQRSYHGKEGKGRYKALALGNHVSFKSTYLDADEQYRTFTIELNRELIDRPMVHSALPVKAESLNTGFKVVIQALNQKIVSQLFTPSALAEIKEKFAIYSLTYPNFSITIGNSALDFRESIRHTETEEHLLADDSGLLYLFNIQVVEWNFDCQRKIYLCNRNGVSFRDVPAGIRPGMPLSIVISSPYIDRLHLENKLDVAGMDSLLNESIAVAKTFGRKYARERLHNKSQEFINNLKKEQLYPYQGEATTEVGRASRQVFDIVALQVNEFLPSFNDQDKKGKKLTLSLIKEALENDTDSLRRILAEVIELPESKRLELAELLDQTPLSKVIDTMKEVTNRLKFLQALERLIYDETLRKNVSERKNLYKIVAQETWIFGDDYTYGVDDNSLKALLGSHVEKLGRTNLEQDINNEVDSESRRIPDVCLCRQFSKGENDCFLNLVVELKGAYTDIGQSEYVQFLEYARSVSQDAIFSKNQHSWRFIMLVKGVKPELNFYIKHKDRVYGHALTDDNVDVFILRWSDIVEKAKNKYEYIQQKLNINLIDNEEGMSLLQNKYRQYLNSDFQSDNQNSSGTV